MLARCTTATLQGLEAIPVEVEVDLGPGLPALQMVGLADTAIRESRERLRSALRNSGFKVPLSRVVVSLAPADLRKEGPGFDLPIALAMLVASGQLQPRSLTGLWCTAELGLEGQLRPVRGVLPLAIAARNAGARALLVAEANGAEAGLVEGLQVWTADTLTTVLTLLEPNPGQRRPQRPGQQRATPCPPLPPASPSRDLGEVQGQEHGRRALEIAAAGSHHLLLVGPPGSGKTMLAQRLAGLLPPLSDAEALALTQIHSVAGLLQDQRSLLATRPFRSPHHSCSKAALIGGGANPRPGELSLAHHGVLFLDELAEFPRDVLDQLRQPLESGEIWIHRAKQQTRFPCQITLVAATNPCPCGWHGHGEHPCSCGEGQRRRYWSRLSGPLLDRLDLQVVVRRVDASHLKLGYQSPARGSAGAASETSSAVAARVSDARQRMTARNPGGLSNGLLSNQQFRAMVRVEQAALDLWETSVRNRRLSGRAADRVMRVAQTICDLGRTPGITTGAVAEALSYRSYDLELKSLPDGS